MSTDTQEMMEMGSRPVQQHAWLRNLIGNWRTEAEMTMPDGSKQKSTGTEKVNDFGGLWALSEGHSTMPGGNPMDYYFGIGWDLTFNEYRAFMVMSVSSHLWKYTGTLSADGKTMTLDCEGPNMMGEGTAMYRDVIHIEDENHRTLTSSGQGPDGNWETYMVVRYTRA